VLLSKDFAVAFLYRLDKLKEMIPTYTISQINDKDLEQKIRAGTSGLK
jgi:hypothetical protein